MSENNTKKDNVKTDENPLGSAPVGSLIIKFAVPSIVAMLVVSLYNLVDQLFIGNSVGGLGNAATNIAYPLTNICIGLGLMFGVGGASRFNLRMGAGEREEAPYYLGNAVTMLLLCGVVMAVIVEIWLEPLLLFFGSPDTVLPYAMEYTRITAIGFPFAIFSSGCSHLLRADGRPNIAMVCNMIGAGINVVLDAWFILGLGWGMSGAAWATIIGQIVGALIGLWFIIHGKTVKLKVKHYIPQLKYLGGIVSLGIAPATNQMCMMIVQILLNNSLKYYGALSVYGEEIPITCAGIISKVGSINVSVIVGLAQGNQPIASYNYGAKNYRRCKEGLYRAYIFGFIASLVTWIIFQTIPDKILSLFGDGSDLYYEFGTRFFRIYYFTVLILFIQTISANFYTAIGKPWKGMFLSLTRQVLYLVPLMLIFPRIWGIDGILYAQPTADIIAAITTIVMMILEFRRPEWEDTKGVLRKP